MQFQRVPSHGRIHGRAFRNSIILLLLLPALPVAVLISPAVVAAIALFATWQQFRLHWSPYQYLWPAAARTVARYGKAMYPEVPELIFPRQVDHYLSSFESPRKWRLLWILVLLDFAPCVAGKLPFSWLSPVERRAFCESSLTHSRGISAIFSRTKQLIRMGRYGIPVNVRSPRRPIHSLTSATEFPRLPAIDAVETIQSVETVEAVA